jgi:hypothetical protein
MGPGRRQAGTAPDDGGGDAVVRPVGAGVAAGHHAAGHPRRGGPPKGGEAVSVAGRRRPGPAGVPGADRFDLARPNADQHPPFGKGLHYCLGASLGKLEARLAWRSSPAGSPGRVRGPHATDLGVGGGNWGARRRPCRRALGNGRDRCRPRAPHAAERHLPSHDGRAARRGPDPAADTPWADSTGHPQARLRSHWVVTAEDYTGVTKRMTFGMGKGHQ